VQPKLNGVRCLAFPDGTLMSRKGKVYKVPHISEVIKNMWHCDELIAFDGELYVHGKSLGDIQSAAKTGGILEDGTKLEFHVYDVVHKDMITQERIEQIGKLQGFSDYFRIVGNAFVPMKHEEVIEQFHDYFTGLGYEGIMLRDPNSLYEIGKRSYSLLKYKKFHDDEFEIVSVYPDKAGNAMFVIWDHIAKVKHDVKYGTHIFGRDCLSGKINVIGKKMTVKYQSRLPDTNIMEFATGVNIRDDYS
jgi:ATP-dependent DNA ligase